MTATKPLRSIQVAATVISTLLMFYTPATASDDTMALLKQMFNNNQYPELLPKLNAAIAASNRTSEAGNHFDLLILKGETLLRTRSFEGAGDAFRAAALLKAEKKQIGVAHATAELIKRSDAGKYQPQNSSDGPKTTAQLSPAIDIIEPDSRKQAFTAFFADLLAKAQPEVDESESASSLSPIMTAAGDVSYARPIELAATDDDKQSVDLLKKLADHANTLMTDALKKLDDKVNAITKTSAKHLKGVRYGPSGSANHGLNGNDMEALTDVVPQARQIAAAALRMEPIFGDIGDFKSIESKADKTIADANALLVKYHYPPVD